MESGRKKRSAMDCALHYLGYRMRSQKEMRDHLQSKRYEPEEIDQAMTRLQELGLLDDAQFAVELVQSKSKGRVGQRKLKQALYRAGIAEDEQLSALATYPVEQEQTACDELFAKLAQNHGTDMKGLAKIQRALLSRGFGYDLIRQSARRFEQGEDWL